MFTFVLETVLSDGRRVVFFGEENRKQVFLATFGCHSLMKEPCIKLKEVPYTATVLANNKDIMVIGQYNGRIEIYDISNPAHPKKLREKVASPDAVPISCCSLHSIA